MTSRAVATQGTLQACSAQSEGSNEKHREYMLSLYTRYCLDI